MAVTWTIVDLEREPSVGALQDAIKTIHWQASDIDNEHTGSAYGSVGLAEPDPQDFTPFADLTEEVVIGWAQDALGEEEVASIQGQIARQIAESKAPSVAHGLPWAT